MVGWFEKKGITQGRILLMVQKDSVEDVDLQDIKLLRAVYTAIDTGEVTAEEAFKDFGEMTNAMHDVDKLIAERKKSKSPDVSKKEADIRERIPGACDSYAKLYVAMNLSKKGADRVHEAVLAAVAGSPEELEGVKKLSDINETDEGRAAIVLEYLKEGQE